MNDFVCSKCFREEFDTIDTDDSTHLIDELVIASDLRKVCFFSCQSQISFGYYSFLSIYRIELKFKVEINQSQLLLSHRILLHQ